ncbi:NUDIX domain-containing protein [Microbacterium terricola]|uniref:NUDIX hydrolase n=1 Tax=Microbacterium terricola TaxID=344163 RepID=A0ABM8DXS6_9MICO|nr:NUDIX hydrolase [Microbacterium terricola]UYK38986.1 NUDIX hydrolase [Microbacterium terricola]BDV30310.1 NUDIX hydrolase [Microbacterium terricola]
MADLLSDDPSEGTVTRSVTVYRGRVWNIRRDEVDYNGETIVREYMDHTGAVAILALDDEDRMLLIKQYRHPVRMRDWEIPAGLLDVAGEDPLASAQRELAEEADLVADRWDVLGEFYTTPGGSDEAIRIYLARGLRSADETFARTAEEADIEVRWAPLDEVVDAILDRRLQNPSLVVGALAAHTSRARGWATLAPADSAWPRRSRALHD